jgi:Domain of unknown function (DUF4335)
MNSPNLQPRQFVHNTCELSIDDKKSPFPAWMKFNKPNPLRFALTVNDPDRPELEPMRVEGDRPKLESLHRTVEDYVKSLVARAPLPQINGEDPSLLPKSTAFDDTINSSDLHRPIDALKVNDEKPRIEADGLSRHLFYLGSGADANTTIMSLSTLQLFDLSSALAEGMTPVPETAAAPEQSENLASASDNLVEPVILPPEAVTNNNQNSVNNSFKSEKSSVEEPRVVLPSESKSSEDLYGLETESSILERSNSDKDRFKMPKPSLGSLNLPDLPDFSRSPLASIPLWLGLGGMAALIIGSPFLMGQFKGGNSVAKKTPTPATQVATAPTDIPSPYQPTPLEVTSGVGTPSASPSSPISTGGINPGSLNSASLAGQGANSGLGRAGDNGKTVTIGAALRPNSSNPLGSLNPQASPSNQTNTKNSDRARAQPTAAANAQQAQSQVNTNKPIKPAADESSSGTPSRNVTNPQSDGQRFKSPFNVNDSSSGQKNSRSRPARNNPVDKPEPNSDFSTGITTSQNPDLGGSGSGLFNTPLSTPSIESPKNLEFPTSPSESVQAKGLQSYFQERWRADPNFDGSLQYKVNVGRNGKVVSLEGADERSRVYLNKTGFLKPGEEVSKNGQQDEKVWLILNSTGEVQTLADGE